MSMDRDRDGYALERRVTRLTAAVIGLALLWGGTVAWLALGRASIPPVIAVERLEIREPDGELAFVLANSARPAAGTMDGEVIMADQAEERRHPSFIFFDGNGDEVGGMAFRTVAGPAGPTTARYLAIDGYKHQETVVLGYTQDPGGTAAGLRVIDHQRGVTLLGALAELGLEPGFTRAELQAAIQAIPAEEREARMGELAGATRVVLGSARDGAAALTLNDGDGRPRIVIEAPADGEPSLRFLDARGETVLRLPQ